MRDFFLRWLLGLAGAAVALLVAALVLDGFDLDGGGFVGALLIFAVLNAALPYVVLRTLTKYASAIVPLSGLISTFAALLITDLVSDGVSISGADTWLGATLLIWVLSMVIWLVPGPWRSFQRTRPAR